MLLPVEEFPEALSHLIGPPNEEGCRPWLGQVQVGGYGRWTTRTAPWSTDRTSVHVGAHRASWAVSRGHAVPEGLAIDHDCHQWALSRGDCSPGPCRHRLCCEPTHLFAEPLYVSRSKRPKYTRVANGSTEAILFGVLTGVISGLSSSSAVPVHEDRSPGGASVAPSTLEPAPQNPLVLRASS